MKARHDEIRTRASRSRTLHLLALGFTVTSLAGCGSGSDDSGSSTVDVAGIVLEPEGSTPAESARALYEFLGQRSESTRDFDVWRCAGTDGRSSDYYFSQGDPQDAGAAVTVSGVGTYFQEAGGERTRRLRYRTTGNDELRMEFSPISSITVEERDEVTTVRIGPGRRWSGFSALRNATLACEEVRSEGRPG